MGIRGLALALAASLPLLRAQSPDLRTVPIEHRDARYSRATDRIYAILGRGPAFQVAELDPEFGTVIRSVSLPGSAEVLAVTDDGRHVYTYSRQIASDIYYVNTASMTVEATYPAPRTDDPGVAFTVTSLLPIRGQPGSYLLAYGKYAVAAFDGHVRRPTDLRTGRCTELIATETSDLVYCYDGESTAFEVNRLRISSDGIAFEGEGARGLVSGFAFRTELATSRGLLYASNGAVANIENRRQEGMFRTFEMPASRTLAIDEQAGLIYFGASYLYFTVLMVHDLSTYLPVARLVLDAARVVPDRLMLTSSGKLVLSNKANAMLFLRASDLPRHQPWQPPPPDDIAPHARLLRIPTSYLAADPANGKLVATLKGDVPGAGNSLLTIDPRSGNVESRVFVGAEPGAPAPSLDGVFTYVPLHGHGAIRRIRNLDGQSDALIPLSGASPFRPPAYPVQAGQVLPLPGNGRSFVVIQEDAPGDKDQVFNFDAVLVYDGETPRPKKTTRSLGLIINTGALSRDGRLLFGLITELIGGGYSRFKIDDGGVEVDGGTIDIGPGQLGCDDLLCATGVGTVFDGATARVFARLPAVGAVVADRDAGRIYQLTSTPRMELREYDRETAQLLRTASFPITGDVYSLHRWKPGEFAALTERGILLISGQALVPVAPAALPPAPQRAGVRRLALAVSSATFDSRRNLIYAAVPASAGANYGNQIVAISPATGAIAKQLPAGSDPSHLRITSDGRFLYASLRTGNAVVRVDLERWTREAVYPVPTPPRALAVPPGETNTFVVSTGFDVSPGLWAFRSGVPSVARTFDHESWVLPVDGSTFLTRDTRWRLTPSGLTVEQRALGQFVRGKGLSVSRGLVFSDGGSLADPSRLTLKEQLEEYAASLPDPDRNRIYYLRREGLRVYEWDTLRIVGELPYEFGPLNNNRPGELFACGGDCLAAVAEGSLHLLDLAEVRWSIPAAPKTVDRTSEGIYRIRVRSAGMAYDSKRDRLYLATPTEEGAAGNSVLVIDPVTGTVVTSLATGSSPAGLAMPDDASRLYVALKGARSIGVFDLDRLQPMPRMPMPLPVPTSPDDYWPMGIAVLPGTGDVLGVSAHNGQDWRQMIVDRGGAMRPNWVGGHPFQTVMGSSIFFNESGSRLHGFDVLQGESGRKGGRWSLAVDSAGVSYQAEPLIGTVETNTAVCGDRVFAASGAIYDRARLALAGRVPMPEEEPRFGEALAVGCDQSTNRLYYWRRFGRPDGSGSTVVRTLLHTFDLSSLALLGSRELPPGGNPVVQMTGVGRAGVALWMSSQPNSQGPYLDTPKDDELLIVRTP